MSSPNIRERHFNISRQNLADQAAAFLYAIGKLQDREVVIDIKFGSNLLTGEGDIISLTVKTREEEEVKWVNHNNNGKER